MPYTGSVRWNENVRLILSDVDETIADLYLPASQAMAQALSHVLADGTSIFFITGQSRASVQWRVVDQIPTRLRQRVLVGSCGGAEVWGYATDGSPLPDPSYSVYDAMMDAGQKYRWREVIDQLVSEFRLKVHAAQPLAAFQELAGNDPFAIMLEDRGPQITFEVVNAYALTEAQADAMGVGIKPVHGTFDLRHAIADRATELLTAAGLPVTPKFGGVFALDFALAGVSKTTSVRHALENEDLLRSIGITDGTITDPAHLEIWGDKFSKLAGGDRHMSEAVDPRVRSIDFRQEDPSEFPEDYNIVLWDGQHHLHDGTLEYLLTRRASGIA